MITIALVLVFTYYTNATKEKPGPRLKNLVEEKDQSPGNKNLGGSAMNRKLIITP